MPGTSHPRSAHSGTRPAVTARAGSAASTADVPATSPGSGYLGPAAETLLAPSSGTETPSRLGRTAPIGFGATGTGSDPVPTGYFLSATVCSDD
jgi:hypothetical protein